MIEKTIEYKEEKKMKKSLIDNETVPPILAERKTWHKKSSEIQSQIERASKRKAALDHLRCFCHFLQQLVISNGCRGVAKLSQQLV